MKNMYRALASTLIPCLFSLQANGATRIVGGEEAFHVDWPYLVSLKLSYMPPDEGHWCGGSLIRPDIVVTAAHCVEDFHSSDLDVWFGLTKNSNYWIEGEKRSIAEIIVHERYNRDTIDNDVALIRLSQPVDFPLIDLPSPDLNIAPGTALDMAGWGALKPNNPNPPDHLQQLTLNSIDNQNCNPGSDLSVTGGMLCAQAQEGIQSGCYGDSGGPLILRGEEHPTLVGISSWVMDCSSKGDATVFARVSYFLPWIEHKLNGLQHQNFTNIDFESGIDTGLWSASEQPDWLLDSDVAHDGSKSMVSPSNIAQLSGATMALDVSVDQKSTLVFWARSESSKGVDWLSFQVGDELLFWQSGQMDWQPAFITLEPGQHHLSWRFYKGEDEKVRDAERRAWIDNIQLIPYQDSDADGLVDFSETKWYQTNPQLADSDSDGWSDEDELLRLDSDPLDSMSPASQLPPGIALSPTLHLVGDFSSWEFLDQNRLIYNPSLQKYYGVLSVLESTEWYIVDSNPATNVACYPSNVQDGENVEPVIGIPAAISCSTGTSIFTSLPGSYLVELTVANDRSAQVLLTYLGGDNDGDGFGDAFEKEYMSTDPFNWDSDGDGINDFEEVVFYGSNPVELDTDGDGLDDGTEITLGLGAAIYSDSDFDGINDAIEQAAGTDPWSFDSDQDGFWDLLEIELANSSPIDANDTPNYQMLQFESADDLASLTFDGMPWVQVDSNYSSDGLIGGKVMASQNHDDNSTSAMRLRQRVGAGYILFSAEVSSEAGFDALIFSIDGVEQDRITSLDAEGFYFPVTAGIHEFEWRYVKDGDTSDWGDRVFIDNIQWPNPTTRFDQNGDGMADLVWRNTTTGEHWWYGMDGASIVQSKPLNRVAAPWQLAGRGDFDGDGKSDLLWRNQDTGLNYIYFMDANTLRQGQQVNVVPANAGWKVQSIADFNGDGFDDMLWRNDQTGAVWLYQMQGATIQAALPVTTLADLNWAVVGTPDLNGDGKADILLRHVQSGVVWKYVMNGHQITQSAKVMQANQDWQLVISGDFDGDGDADLLWRNVQDGRNYVYLMDKGVVNWQNRGLISQFSDQDWQAVFAADLNGDGKDDIVWRHATSGQNYLYSMDGIAYQGSVINTIADGDWVVVR